MEQAMNQPSVGIGLPVYQNGKYLAATLDSILGQTYQNIVVYLSEDQSDDNTAEICRRYAEQDQRIVYSQNETNLGEIDNHQRVLDLAETDYFMFARGHELLPKNLVADGVSILQNDPEVALAFARTVWIDEDSNSIADKHLSYFDTRGCDVVSRCALVFWGKYEYFYGVTKTSTMKSIRALEPMIGTDLIMLFEMALAGSFAHIPDGERGRRYYYDGESYDERIKRYQRTLYKRLGFTDRYFPFLKLPFKLFGSVLASDYSFLTKLSLLFVILFNAPLKYLTARGKAL